MNVSGDTESSRGYRPHFDVRYCGSQRERFGAENNDGILAMLETNDSEDYPDDFDGEWADFPRISRLRMNLTALSQVYNLYFVAYRGYVHVYQPNRTTATLLERSPLLVLDPHDSATPMSALVTGHVNRRCPHEVNNMIVGNLGNQEILLLCRDNGDVVAWYTHDIARLAEDRLLRPDHSTKKVARHFFADSVGISAWGLAIHTPSRLIAVSANSSEVTVFAFALNDTEDESGDLEEEEEKEDEEAKEEAKEGEEAKGEEKKDEEGTEEDDDEDYKKRYGVNKKQHERITKAREEFMKKEDEAIARLEAKFRKRNRTWRIVIPLGVGVSNLPSVAFCDDIEGHADRVAAIDIDGYTYVASIWSIRTSVLTIRPHNVQTLVGGRATQAAGWNILPIMDEQLRPTNTLRAAIGMPPKKAIYRGKTPRGAWLDISKGMKEVPNDAAHAAHCHRNARFYALDISSGDDGLDRRHEDVTTKLWRLPEKVYNPLLDENDKFDLGDGVRPVRIAMTMVNASGDHFGEFSSPKALVEFASDLGYTSSRARKMCLSESLPNCGSRKCIVDENGNFLGERISFLRAYDDNVEILCQDYKEKGCGVVCHHLLTQVHHPRQEMLWDMQYGNRCSLLLTIPELNLVILGTMGGRVALLTLTQPPLKAQPPKTRAHRTFRVEAVLPFEAEERSGERPLVCLLGIAVSPVPETSAKGLVLKKSRPVAYGGRKRTRQTPEVEWAEPNNRWRLILNYMDHTILQYDIVGQQDNDMDAESSPQQQPRRRNTRCVPAASSSSCQSNGPEVEEKEEDFEYAYFPDYRPYPRHPYSGMQGRHERLPTTAMLQTDHGSEEDSQDEETEEQDDDETVSDGEEEGDEQDDDETVSGEEEEGSEEDSQDEETEEQDDDETVSDEEEEDDEDQD